MLYTTGYSAPLWLGVMMEYDLVVFRNSFFFYPDTI